MPTYSARPVSAARPMFALAALLTSVADPFRGVELERVQRRRDEQPVAPAAADLAMDAGADFEPGRRDDHGVDERPLDTVVDRRLVALVEDADRHQQHAGAHVEAAGQQEVDIRLFELELAAFLEPLDEGVLQLELTDEADVRARTRGSRAARSDGSRGGRRHARACCSGSPCSRTGASAAAVRPRPFALLPARATDASASASPTAFANANN